MIVVMPQRRMNELFIALAVYPHLARKQEKSHLAELEAGLRCATWL